MKRIDIYQINMDRDPDRLCFMNSEWWKKHGLDLNQIDRRLYEHVWSGELPVSDAEDVYRIFNTDRPQDFIGRSLSVSDIVGISDPATGVTELLFCDSVGFRPCGWRRGS